MFNQMKGKLKETWGRLTDDDIALYEGKRDQFLGRIAGKIRLRQRRSGSPA